MLFNKQTNKENSILAALSSSDYEHLQPHLEEIDLPAEHNIYNWGDAIRYVYFPIDAIVCLFTTLEDGATIETGIVGSEGVLGISSILGVKTTPSQAMALSHKKALRIRAELLKKEFDAGGKLQNLLLRYIHAVYVQNLQTAACNRHHNMEGRLCRWLLMMHDRNDSNDLEVTQEFISEMLGTRRPYVTTAAGILQKKEIIKCRRGHIEILDRRGLETSSCECYDIIHEEFNRLDEITDAYDNSRTVH